MHDLIIIGGGPAGVSAAVYAARKLIKSVLITDEFGGQSTVSDDIQNWIGTPHISGADLAKSFEAHVREYAGSVITIKDKSFVKSVEKTERDGQTIFLTHVESRNGEKVTYESKAVLVGTGSKRRKLPAKGADTFEHKGVTYCATCDGPLFTGMPVVVVGGGNAAFESALQLAAYCSHVYILNRTKTFRADEVTVAVTTKKENISIITDAVIDEVLGDKFVDRIIYTVGGREKTELAVNGVFVEIGQLPNTDFVKGVVNMNEIGNIVVDPRNQRTSTLGLWAAGDCTDGLYHQNNIAAGDAVKALEDIYTHLQH
ncbi:MAG: hypothetical protein RJB39_323 [Candidatus Parcubacteria bacterium]|jgi:alkyl hydroperoxide reductase subunit F